MKEFRTSAVKTRQQHSGIETIRPISLGFQTYLSVIHVLRKCFKVKSLQLLYIRDMMINTWTGVGYGGVWGEIHKTNCQCFISSYSGSFEPRCFADWSFQFLFESHSIVCSWHIPSICILCLLLLHLPNSEDALDGRRDKLPYWIVLFNTLGVFPVRSLMAMEGCTNVEERKDSNRKYPKMIPGSWSWVQQNSQHHS